MPSFNRVMQLWHAYKKTNKIRKHLGYYAELADAQEAERLGVRTSKAVQSKTATVQISVKIATELLVEHHNRPTTDRTPDRSDPTMDGVSA